jgi:hypothetical protein
MAQLSLGNTLTTGLVLTSDTTGNLVVTTTGGYCDMSTVSGGLSLPAGNTDQRPTGIANGTLRYNTTTSSVEGYVAGVWGSIGGGGGSGAVANGVITLSNSVISNAYTLSSNGITSGAVTVNATVTFENNARWVIN